MLTRKTKWSSLHDSSKWAIIVLLSMLYLLFYPYKCFNSPQHYIIAFACNFLLWHFPSEPKIVFGLCLETSWCQEKIFSPLGFTWRKVPVAVLLLTLSFKGQRNTFCISSVISGTWPHYLNMSDGRKSPGEKETLLWLQLVRWFFFK